MSYLKTSKPKQDLVEKVNVLRAEVDKITIGIQDFEDRMEQLESKLLNKMDALTDLIVNLVAKK